MLPYLTDYENDRRHSRPRMANLILVLLPFMVLYRATELWLSDVYLFEWMRHNHYARVWFILAMLSFVRPRFSIYAAYADAVVIIISQILDELILQNNIIRATPEDYQMICCGKLSHKGFWIWSKLFFAAIVLYIAYVRAVEPWIKARRGKAISWPSEWWCGDGA